MRGGGHVPENAAEAVEEGWRTAHDVLWSEKHARTDLMAIVEDRAMGEAGSLGSGGCAGGELDVDNVMVGQILGRKRS